MRDDSSIFEKLGLFYLGKEYDLDERKLRDDYVLYASRDLVTHAVCIGMTGSGKTGLGVSILEEAAIDGVPALVIDPKGDLTNLLLTFPQLRPEDFLPWVAAEDAERQGMSPLELATGQAELWRQGLASWGQAPERIARLSQAADFTIFTPGSDAGVPISILSSFATPPAAVMQDGDALRDQVATLATSLLALLGISADPIRSREHILLTTIIEHYWREGTDLDLGGLIRSLQNPPVHQIGVMDLESFFPSKDRFDLATALNNLLASPGFSAWLSGEPLDIDRLLHDASGKPRVSIFYTAHLNDAERLFFTTLLLQQTIGWMRSRPGTTTLRALLYIDELFGYMPPIGEPPTKKPLLTLLKQARAFGVGLVLATQNPVDLDYKGLSNAGTWFLGRLQTERDKERVLDGLQGASADSQGSWNRAQMAEMLSSLGKRVFLMKNVHEAEPVLFQTRWALSYLAGPLTRTQVRALMQAKREAGVGSPSPRTAGREDLDRPADSPTESRAHRTSRPAAAAGAGRPVLPPEIGQVYLPARRALGYASPIVYEPKLLAMARVQYNDTRRGLHAAEELLLLADFPEGALGIDWSVATELDLAPDLLTSDGSPDAEYLPVPREASVAKNYKAWSRSFGDHLYRTRRYSLLHCHELEMISEPGEEERSFRIRIADRAREVRDARCDQIRQRYASKLRSLEDRRRRADEKLARERHEASSARTDSVISIGATILSAVLGRKRLSATTVGQASTAARGASRAARQADDVRRAEATVEEFEQQIQELQDQLRHEIQAMEQGLDAFALRIEPFPLKPRRQDVEVRHVLLAWLPCHRDATGVLAPMS